MRTFDRYVLSQMLTLFGFFALVLAGIYWINRAVDLFDRLISDGQSALIFLEFSLLTLPTVIRLVIPVAAFAAALYVTNRMRSEAEITVVQAAGMSPLRGARPVLVFGLSAGTLCLLLTHVLGPVSKERLAARSGQIAEDVTAGLLEEGRFLHPADDITVFIDAVAAGGKLSGVFLSDQRSDGNATLYVAENAALLGSAGGPRLVMYDGMAQTLDSEGRLGTTRFQDFTLDISTLDRGSVGNGRDLREISSTALWSDPAEAAAETGTTLRRVRLELAERTTQAAQAAVAPVLGYAVMMLGAFSRFAAWRQVTAASVALILYELADNVIFDAAVSGDMPVEALGAPSVFVFIGALTLLLRARTALRRKRVATA